MITNSTAPPGACNYTCLGPILTGFVKSFADLSANLTSALSELNHRYEEQEEFIVALHGKISAQNDVIASYEQRFAEIEKQLGKWLSAIH